MYVHRIYIWLHMFLLLYLLLSAVTSITTSDCVGAVGNRKRTSPDGAVPVLQWSPQANSARTRMAASSAAVVPHPSSLHRYHQAHGARSLWRCELKLAPGCHPTELTSKSAMYQVQTPPPHHYPKHPRINHHQTIARAEGSPTSVPLKMLGGSSLSWSKLLAKSGVSWKLFARQTAWDLSYFVQDATRLPRKWTDSAWPGGTRSDCEQIFATTTRWEIGRSLGHDPSLGFTLIWRKQLLTEDWIPAEDWVPRIPTNTCIYVSVFYAHI